MAEGSLDPPQAIPLLRLPGIEQKISPTLKRPPVSATGGRFAVYLLYNIAFLFLVDFKFESLRHFAGVLLQGVAVKSVLAYAKTESTQLMILNGM